MPTGYTAGVADGTITSFKEFALLCARAFGATITLRDEPMSSDIPEFEPSPYHAEQLATLNRRKAEVEAMTTAQCYAEADAAFRIALDRHETRTEENRQRIERYRAMLQQAEAFEAPTEEHQAHRDFMISQLVESMKFDDDSKYLVQPERLSGEQWKAAALERIAREIAYHEKGWREEVERTNQRNAWVKALKDSLEHLD